MSFERNHYVRVTDEEEPVSAEQPAREMIRVTDDEPEAESSQESSVEEQAGRSVQGSEQSERTASELATETAKEREGKLEELKAEMTGHETAPATKEEAMQRIAELEEKAREYDKVKRYEELVGLRDAEALQAQSRADAGFDTGYGKFSDDELRAQIAADESAQNSVGSKVRNSWLFRKAAGFISGRPAGLMSTTEATRPGQLRTELSLRAKRRAEAGSRDEEIASLQRELDGMEHAAPAKQADGSYSVQSLGTQYRFSGGYSGARHRADSLRAQMPGAGSQGV